MAEPTLATRIAAMLTSGNRCAFPDCETRLYNQETGDYIAELGHIHGHRPGSARYDPGLTEEEANSYANLVALCPTHHTIVDKDRAGSTYPPEMLRGWKREREQHTDGPGNAFSSDQELLRRLVDALSPAVPDEWWKRPGAPEFRLNCASTRHNDRPWIYEVGLEQIGGGDIGNPRAGFRGATLGGEVKELSRDTAAKKWKISPFVFERLSEPGGLNLEVRFWWNGADRRMIWVWPHVQDYQNVTAELLYS